MKQLKSGPRYVPALEDVDIEYCLFDIDNTLVGNESPDLPSKRFIAAAHGARDKAVIGMATARPLPKAKHIIKAARMEGLSILSNGAQIYDGKAGEMKLERVLPLAPAKEIVRHLQALGMEHWVQDNGVDYVWPGESIVSAKGRSLGDYVRAKNIWQPATGKNRLFVRSYQPEKPLIIMAHNVTADNVKVVEEIGRAYGGKGITSLIAHQTMQSDGNTVYDVFLLDHRANKKDALLTVSDLSGVSAEQTMATGDGPNDAVIVEYAGVGVAVDNAVDQTKAVAGFIAPSRQADGAAIALEQLVLKKRS